MRTLEIGSTAYAAAVIDSLLIRWIKDNNTVAVTPASLFCTDCNLSIIELSARSFTWRESTWQSERNKLCRNIDCKLVLVVLVAAGTFSPRIPEFIHTTRLLTLGLCECSEAGEVSKSGICASARTITSQWLTRFVIVSPVKTQVALHFFVRLYHHVFYGPFD